jgi:hypothetical protein
MNKQTSVWKRITEESNWGEHVRYNGHPIKSGTLFNIRLGDGTILTLPIRIAVHWRTVDDYGHQSPIKSETAFFDITYRGTPASINATEVDVIFASEPEAVERDYQRDLSIMRARKAGLIS